MTYDLESERYIELSGDGSTGELGTDGGFGDGSGVWNSVAVSTPVFAAGERTKDVG